MQTKKYSYAITNLTTGEMVEVVNCPKKALAVAFALSCVDGKISHTWDKGMKCWTLTLQLGDQEPQLIACSFFPEPEKALEHMISHAVVWVNNTNLIAPLHIDYDIHISDIARSTESDRVYVWFQQGIANFAAIVEPQQQILSINWAADLTDPDKHWLDISPSLHQWVIKLLLGVAGISVDSLNLRQNPAKLSWQWD